MTTTKCLLVLVLAASATACAAPLAPPADAKLVDASAVVAFIQGYYFEPTTAPPAVYLQQPNCLGANDADGVPSGITEPVGHTCVYGWTSDDLSFIVISPTAHPKKWSELGLVHELEHVALGGDPMHTDVQAWGPPAAGGWGGRVGACRTALSLHPELDSMGLPTVVLK